MCVVKLIFHEKVNKLTTMFLIPIRINTIGPFNFTQRSLKRVLIFTYYIISEHEKNTLPFTD